MRNTPEGINSTLDIQKNTSNLEDRIMEINQLEQ